MAEYQDVMKQMERMCDSNICDKCPIVSYCGKGRSINVSATDADKVEELVMAWAEEHPEPVYPTWGEWLEKQGVIKRIHSPRYEENGASYYTPTYEITNPIPADTAQKLGIEPKEESDDG